MLHVHGIGAVVFEGREASPRTHALRAAPSTSIPNRGDWPCTRPDWTPSSIAARPPGGEDLRIADRTGRVLVNKITPDDAPRRRPEIDQGAATNLARLATRGDGSLWGRRLLRGIPLADGRHRLEFEDGSTEVCDLLVGADGAHSRVRPLVTDVLLEYTGVTMVELGVPDVDRTHPKIAKMIGRGSFWVLADRRCLVAQRNSQGRVRVYLALHTDKDWIASCGIPFDFPSKARAALAGLLSGLRPSHRPAGRLRWRGHTSADRALPVGLTWRPTPGVTLLGGALLDATGRRGANMAMSTEPGWPWP